MKTLIQIVLFSLIASTFSPNEVQAQAFAGCLRHAYDSPYVTKSYCFIDEPNIPSTYWPNIQATRFNGQMSHDHTECQGTYYSAGQSLSYPANETNFDTNNLVYKETAITSQWLCSVWDPFQQVWIYDSRVRISEGWTGRTWYKNGSGVWTIYTSDGVSSSEVHYPY